MTRLTRDPWEVDEDAYGPSDEPRRPLPLPKWNPATDRERRAFMRWCIVMLERERQERDLEPAMRELSSDDKAVRLLRDLVDQPMFGKLREDMPFLSWKDFQRLRYGPDGDPKGNAEKTGPKPDDKIVAAIIDNARLTDLFKRHFHGKFQRRTPPSRSDILRARHGLNDEQTLDLLDRIG